MIVSIVNYQTQNIIFFGLLILAIFLTLRKRKDRGVMSIDSTTELKGLAILAVILAHVGFCLVTDYHFLMPLSAWAGVGVDLFLFLSAFGLTLSALKRSLSIPQFYWKRLSRVIMPIWIILVILLILDKVFLGILYPLKLTIQNFFGWFPEADIFNNINSPLWFITPLIFYYIIFPIIFIKKIPEISAILIYVICIYVLKVDFSVSDRVKELWTLHYLAFPLGIIFASAVVRLKKYSTQIITLRSRIRPVYLEVSRYLLLVVSVVFWWYLLKNINGNTLLQSQLISLASLLVTVLFFIMKPVQSQFLVWLGVYSFEIYMLHWPLLYRYDVFFKFLPASIALIIYLVFFIVIGFIIKNCSFKRYINKIQIKYK